MLQQGRGFIWLIFLVLLSCGKKYPRVNYLSPRDREKDGFVDQDTWQQVSFGNFFPKELALGNIASIVVYYPLPEKFSYDNLSKFSKETFFDTKEAKIKITYQKFLMRDLLNLEEKDEVLFEASPEKLPEALYAKITLKKNLFHHACDHAYAVGLYQFITLLDKDKKGGITKEQLTALDARYFPLPDYYFAETHKAIDFLKPFLEAKNLKHEVVSEIPDPLNPFRCKIVIHYKQKDLILKEPALLQKAQIHD